MTSATIDLSNLVLVALAIGTALLVVLIVIAIVGVTGIGIADGVKDLARSRRTGKRLGEAGKNLVGWIVTLILAGTVYALFHFDVVKL
jgi:phosphate/sulfate permease